MKTLVDYFKHEITLQSDFEWAKDMEIVDVKPGYVEGLFHSDAKRHANIRGGLHGAVSLAFADTLMGMAARSLGKMSATVELSGNYVKAGVAGETIRGVVKTQHAGRTLITMTTHIYNEEDELIHMAKATFFCLKPYELPDLPWTLE